MITDFTKHHYKRMDCNNYNSATQTGATNKQSVQCLDNDNNLDKDSTLLSNSNNNLTLDDRKVMLGNTQKYLPESYTTLELRSVIQISAEQQPNSELAESNPIADKSTQNSNPFNENSFKKNKSTKTCDAIFEMDDYVKDVMHGFILKQQNNYSNNV